MYNEKNIGKFGSSDVSRDDFWDISELIPKKKKPTPAPPTGHPPFAEISVDGEGVRKSRDERSVRIDFSSLPSALASEEEEYVPEANRLITRVRIRSSDKGYNFYERFKNDAARLYSRMGS